MTAPDRTAQSIPLLVNTLKRSVHKINQNTQRGCYAVGRGNKGIETTKERKKNRVIIVSKKKSKEKAKTDSHNYSVSNRATCKSIPKPSPGRKKLNITTEKRGEN